MRIKEQQGFRGIKISRRGPSINHLLFVEDYLVFFKTNVHSCRKIKKLMKDFSNLSGLKINFTKSELYTSSNCSIRKQKWFTSILGVKHTSSPPKYLGIDFRKMNKKKEFFQPLIDKIQLKLAGWKA